MKDTNYDIFRASVVLGQVRKETVFYEATGNPAVNAEYVVRITFSKLLSDRLNVRTSGIITRYS